MLRGEIGRAGCGTWDTNRVRELVGHTKEYVRPPVVVLDPFLLFTPLFFLTGRANASPFWTQGHTSGREKISAAAWPSRRAVVD